MPTAASIQRELGWTPEQIKQMHGGKFEAILGVGAHWGSGIKEERVKKGGKAA